MKMKPEHFEHLRQQVGATLEQYKDQAYKYKGRDKRWRWDLLYATKGLNAWICAELYSYLNDDHIDTALRQIVPPID